jgi:D-serine deaminase-like pyridoxal phosphate-dependent protein
MNRRQFVIGAAGLTAAAAWYVRPTDNGGEYAPFFEKLNGVLQKNGPWVPSMVVDLDALDRNIDLITQSIGPDKNFRVVAKSIPSPELIQYVAKRAETNRIMVFHQPFLNRLVELMPKSDILMGKPMPVQAAKIFYQQHRGPFDSETQLQWLIDTPSRALEYLELAKSVGKKLRLNVEIDVGLHRGGVQNNQELGRILATIQDHPNALEFAGFMGYDPHVAKLPSFVGTPSALLDSALGIYQARVDYCKANFTALWHDNLTLNAAGSPTYRLYEGRDLANDISVGSALVKATDFDIETLDVHEPALYIATPVLKASEGLKLPGIDSAGKFLSWWDINQAQTFFVYGGYWKATPYQPPGLQLSSVYGRSTNQEMVNASSSVRVAVGDHVFFRPTQSEHVMLQFGDLLAYRGGEIIAEWPVLSA